MITRSKYAKPLTYNTNDKTISKQFVSSSNSSDLIQELQGSNLGIGTLTTLAEIFHNVPPNKCQGSTSDQAMTISFHTLLYYPIHLSPSHSMLLFIT
jgi:hypothetical protein